MFKKVPLPKDANCLNCGHNIEEFKYCPECGQENVNYTVSVRQLFTYYLGRYFSLDAKLVRTLWCLISKPWKLSESFIQGKRKTYTNPFRIYLIMSVLFIFALKVQKNYATPESTDKPTIVELDKGEVDSQKLNEYFTKQLSNALLVSIPFMGLILYGLYFRRKKWYFVDHLTLMTHSYTLVYLLSLPFLLIKPLNPFIGLVYVIVSVYLWLMMKKFYGQSRLKTTLKFILFNLLCFLVFATIIMIFAFLYFTQVEIIDALGWNV